MVNYWLAIRTPKGVATWYDILVCRRHMLIIDTGDFPICHRESGVYSSTGFDILQVHLTRVLSGKAGKRGPKKD